MEVAPHIQKKALTVALTTVFLDMVGFGILIPILPLVLIDPTNPLYLFSQSVSEHTRYITLGFVVALYPLFQLIATPILGQLSDRWGRKPILIFSLGGTLFSYALIMLAVQSRNLPLLLLARAIDGISGGNISVAQALVSDVSVRKERARFFGFLGASYGLGVIIGPLVAGRLTMGWGYQTFGLMGPYVFTMLLALINVLFITFTLPETQMLRKKAKIKLVEAATHVIIAFQMKRTRFLFLMNFLVYASFSFMSSFISIFLVSRFHMGSDRIGVLVSIMGISLAVGQIFFTKILIKRAGSEEQALVTSLFGAACGVVLMYLSGSPRALFMTAPFFGVFLGLSQAYLLSLVSKSVSEQQQGEVMGLNSSVTSLAQAIPPILSGFAAAAFTPATPMLIAAGSLALAGSIYHHHLVIKKRNT